MQICKDRLLVVNLQVLERPRQLVPLLLGGLFRLWRQPVIHPMYLLCGSVHITIVWYHLHVMKVLQLQWLSFYSYWLFASFVDDSSPTAIALGSSAIAKVSGQNCFRTLDGSLGQIHLGPPERHAEGSAKLPPRIQQGSTKVLQVSWCLWADPSWAARKVPRKVPPRFHQGSSKVSPRFHQTSSSFVVSLVVWGRSFLGCQKVPRYCIMSHPYTSSPQTTTHHLVAVGVFFGLIWYFFSTILGFYHNVFCCPIFIPSSSLLLYSSCGLSVSLPVRILSAIFFVRVTNSSPICPAVLCIVVVTDSSLSR